jgi:hypothetical protein
VHALCRFPGANRIARAVKKISAPRIRHCLASRSPVSPTNTRRALAAVIRPPGRSQENSVYELLIAEIARARSEERICGIPGPQFARTRDKQLRNATHDAPGVHRTDSTRPSPRVAPA